MEFRRQHRNAALKWYELQGLTFEALTEKLGISKVTIHKIIKSPLPFEMRESKWQEFLDKTGIQFKNKSSDEEVLSLPEIALEDTSGKSSVKLLLPENSPLQEMTLNHRYRIKGVDDFEQQFFAILKVTDDSMKPFLDVDDFAIVKLGPVLKHGKDGHSNFLDCISGTEIVACQLGDEGVDFRIVEPEEDVPLISVTNYEFGKKYHYPQALRPQSNFEIYGKVLAKGCLQKGMSAMCKAGIFLSMLFMVFLLEYKVIEKRTHLQALKIGRSAAIERLEVESSSVLRKAYLSQLNSINKKLDDQKLARMLLLI